MGRAAALSHCAWILSGITGVGFGQNTTAVSINNAGHIGSHSSAGCSISADGRFVAFFSESVNLVSGDTNGWPDVFVRDRERGATTRVSVSSGGEQGDGMSYLSAMTADGRCVVFCSSASNLVLADTNGEEDIFYHDRSTGETTRASVDSSGLQGNSRSFDPAITPDGRFVAFVSAADNLVEADTNERWDIFLHDRLSGETSLVSVSSSGAQGDGDSDNPKLSADGRYVAYWSHSENLVPGDTNGSSDVFVFDRENGTTARVSVSSAGIQGEGWSSNPSISGDGRIVAFQSTSNNLVHGDSNIYSDIFVHDRVTGKTRRVSISSEGVQANGHCSGPSLSADGSTVAFTSTASTLVPDDTNGKYDAFLHDLSRGRTICASLSTTGEQGLGHTTEVSLSADGRYVAFSSRSAFMEDDTNGRADVYARGPDLTGTNYCHALANSTGFPARISGSGPMDVSLGNLVLTCAPVPDEVGLFLHAAGRTQVVFGNGFLCAAGDLVRGALVHASGNFVSYAYDNSDTQHSLVPFAGSYRHFQYWFRDGAGGGALFNTSNGISILLLP